jgi:small-conductance mechanosensitive channel
MYAAGVGATLVVEVLLGARADVDAVSNEVDCCMYVVNFAESTLEHYRVVHLHCLNSYCWSLWYIHIRRSAN